MAPFSRIKADGRTKQRGQGSGCLLAYALGQSEVSESRDTGNQASELDGHCRRDHNLPEQATQQIPLADAAEVDYDGSIGNDDHLGNRVIKVWRSSASICSV